MKKSVLLAFALSFGIIQVASATETIPQAICSLATPAMDYGIDAQVNLNSGPMVVGSVHHSYLEAVVVENTFAGPREFGDFAVTKEPIGPAGAPLVYSGSNFTLTIFVDTAPINGKVRAHLTAEAQGRQLSEEMLCTLR